MHWQRFYIPNMPEMELYHTMHPSGITFCISFDHAHPDMLWRASYRRFGELTTYLEPGFDTQVDALDALMKFTPPCA